MIVAEYLDQATGSSTNGRPEFKRLFQDAAQRRFDLVLFWALDRFTREGTLLTLQYLEQLTSYGVGWRSFTEQYLDSTGLFRDAVISILATIAKQKRVRISERVKAGLAHARRTGKHLGRPRVGVDAFRIASLRAQGRSWAQITAETGVSKGTAQRAVLALPKID
jgi:DNA invertase Pin-like site-specific DNA recombinase